MNLSPEGQAFLVAVEGCIPYVYRDDARNLTIGVGHKLTPQELHSGVIEVAGIPTPWQWTPAQCQLLLRQDAQWAVDAVNQYVTRPLTQPQFDALVSFCFNMGVEGFRESDVLTAVNAHRDTEVPQMLQEYEAAGGHHDPGLVVRRQKESALWNGTYEEDA